MLPPRNRTLTPAAADLAAPEGSAVLLHRRWLPVLTCLDLQSAVQLLKFYRGCSVSAGAVSSLLLGGCLSAALLIASRCSPLPTKVRAILQSARQHQPLCASTFFPFLLPPTFQKPKRCCANAVPPPSPRPSRVFEAVVPLDQLHPDASDPCAQGRCSPRPAAPRRTLSFSSSVLF